LCSEPDICGRVIGVQRLADIHKSALEVEV